MIGTQDLSRVEGATVYDETGDKIGKVSQIYLDDTTQDPAWVTVNTGFFGTSESFVPLQRAELSGDDVRVPYAKAQVKDAPRVDPDQHISREEERELYRYYGLDETGFSGNGTTGTSGTTDTTATGYADTTATTGTSGTTGTTDEASVTLSEEQLDVHKESHETGRVRLRKYTTTETQQVEVPVTKERLRVERTPATGTATGGHIADDDSVEEITLREERVDVTKEAVPVEEVRVAKEQVTEHETVSDDVRKEHADLDLEGKAGEQVRDDRR